jgi:hypothetical protein
MLSAMLSFVYLFFVLFDYVPKVIYKGNATQIVVDETGKCVDEKMIIQ